jgi:lipoprotein-releasing system permease protein
MQHMEYFIAKRYLLSNRKVRFINIIGFISVVGITVGVAALLIVLAVFNGFSDVVTNVLVGFDPHLRIEKKGNFTGEEIASMEKILHQEPQITGIAPFVSGKAMLVAKSYNRVVYLRGMDDGQVASVSGLKEKLLYGNVRLKESNGVGDIIIGLSLADRLGTITGDEITIISPHGFQSALSSFGVPQTLKFRVSGIYESNNRDYDANYAYISISSAQRLFDKEGRYNGIEVRTGDFKNADNVKSAIAPKLPQDVTVSTWYDLHKSLYSVMKVERWSAYILLSLIILVATFNMLGSLSMSVVEKKRDIGVLKSMGASSREIINIFMVEGLLIGIIGTILGFMLGLIVIYLQMKYQLFSLDTNVYIIPAIPVKIEWSDFIAVAFASMGLTFLASYYPAKKAAKSIVSESLRWE